MKIQNINTYTLFEDKEPFNWIKQLPVSTGKVHCRRP